MATAFQVTFDCTDPSSLAKFWIKTLGYQEDPPPAGFATWPEWLTAHHVPQEMWNNATAIVDPDGKGSRIFFQKVPEGKTVKNRMHLDVRVNADYQTGTAEERQQKIEKRIKELVEHGATHITNKNELGQYWAVMQDPEGNEFCLS